MICGKVFVAPAAIYFQAEQKAIGAEIPGMLRAGQDLDRRL